MKPPRRLILTGLAAFVGVVLLAIFWPHGGSAETPACASRTFEGSRFIVCAFDARRDELMLASRGADRDYLRSFDRLAADLGDDAARVRFAMNAGMFDRAGAPIGLFVAEGEEQHPISLTDGPGNFHMKPNGVFWQDESGVVHVDTAEAYAAEPRAVRWATQSGPMLVINGELHPQIQRDGPSRYIRNGVGVRDGHTAYFVLSGGAVSFGRFARFFRDRLHCDNALFLDGSVSSLWAPEMDRRDESERLGPLVVVLSGYPRPHT